MGGEKYTNSRSVPATAGMGQQLWAKAPVAGGKGAPQQWCAPHARRGGQAPATTDVMLCSFTKVPAVARSWGP